MRSRMFRFLCVVFCLGSSSSCLTLTAQIVPHPYTSFVRSQEQISRDVSKGLIRRAYFQLQQLEQQQGITSASERVSFDRSSVLRGSNNPVGADRTLSNFAAQRPNSPLHPLAYVQRGLAALEVDDFEKAIDLLGTGSRLSEDEIQRRNDPWYRSIAHMARFWQGVSRARLGMYGEALRSFELCVQIDSAGEYAERSRFVIGETYEHNAQIDSAIVVFESIPRMYPKGTLRIASRIRAAQNLLRLRKPEKAIDALVGIDKLIEANANNDTSVIATQEDIEHASEEVLLIRATSMLIRGSYQMGVDSCTKILTQFPETPYRNLVLLNRGFALLSLDRSVEALADFATILETESTDGSQVRYQALLYRAIGLKRSGRTEEANKAFLDLSAQSDFPYQAHALVEVGQVAYEGGRYADARRAFERAVRSSEDAATTIRAQLLLGAALIELRDWRNAAKSYQEAEDLCSGASERYVPNKDRYLAESRLKRGICLVQANDRRNAITALTDYLGNHPTDTQRDEGTFWLAEAMYGAELLKNAQELYREIVVSQTASVHREEAMYGLGWTQFRQRQFSQCIKTFSDLVKNYPDSRYAVDALIRTGDAYYITKNFENAARQYEQAEKRNSTSPEGRYAAYQVGQALYRANNLGAASSKLRAFATKNAGSRLADDALFLVGWIDFQQGNNAGAIATFQQILELYPDGDHAVKALYTIADARFNMGDMEGAITSYRRVINQFPSHALAAEAAKSMQQVLMGLDRTEEALAIADTLINANPNSQMAEEFAFKKAEIFYSGQKYQNAASELEAYINRYPGSDRNDEAMYLLGKSYLTIDEIGQARAAMAKLERSHPNSPFIAQSKLDLASYFDQHANAKSADSLYGIITSNHANDSAIASQAGFERAALARVVGDTTKSVQYFRKTADNYAGKEYGDQARYQLALHYRRINKPDSARNELAILVRTAGRDLIAANALYDIGDTYARQRMWPEAKEAFLRVRNDYAGQEDWYTLALIGLGACYEQLDEADEAKQVYGVVVELRPDDDYGRTAQARLDRLERKR